MKTTLFTIFIFVATTSINAQDSIQNAFDFWIGEWNLTWQNKDGSISKGGK